MKTIVNIKKYIITMYMYEFYPLGKNLKYI